MANIEAAEIAAVGKRPAVDDVENADMARHVMFCGAGIGNIKLRLIGREGKAVRLDEILDDGVDRPACRIDPVDVARGLLGLGLVALVIRQDAVGRIGEPDPAVGVYDDVVRRVQPFALVAVGENGDGAVRLGAGDAAAAMFAGDQLSPAGRGYCR